MKTRLHQRNENQRYSSRIVVGDYVPYFVIQNEDRILDIQNKACQYNLLLFVPSNHEELLSEAALLDSQYNHLVISDDLTQFRHPELYFDADIFRLFAEPEAKVTACLCDRNLKLCYSQGGDSLDAVLEQLPAGTGLPYTECPPPVLIVPDVISPDLSRRLMEYLDSNPDQAFRNSSDYKSRSHIHPSKELQQELDDKLCKSLLPEIEKVFYSQISHRETYKICCYAADESGCFGKHRDTIDPHLHRRYALTLVLNDEFEGGGINFPEYSEDVMVVPRNWAIVFPGSLFHRVETIGVGRRYVIVSFFFSESEAAVKEGSERYRFQVQRDLGGVNINRLTPDSDS